MNRLSSARRARRIAALLAAVVLAIVITRADAAYRILRPIAIGTYGYINQYNLYGEGSGTGHKGVDFPAALDTSVYAVADGVVRQVKEDGGDNCTRFQCGWFGNFILVRHNQPHYDRITGQQAYVYALYAHLSFLGANVNANDPVSAGQDIGDVDNTGYSFGNHLHLQIMIDPDPYRTITDIFNLDWTETTSRNPELWLTPYNGTTGTVVGKVTYPNGEPYYGRFICGLEKLTLGGYDYETSLTYSNTTLKADDILVENWATTDVTPATYEVFSCPSSACTGCISMGTHMVEAGKITYVGLFPVWLPYVRGSGSGWNSTIYVRNNSDTYRAHVNITYFDLSGSVYSHRGDYVNANGSLAVIPPNGFGGSAMVVSSEDIAVAVLNEHTSPLSYSAYAGVITPTTTVMIPLIHRNNSGWNSLISIQNAGPTTTSATVTFRSQSINCPQTYPLAPGATVRIYTDVLTCLGTTFVGSAQVTASQPLAVTSLQYSTNYASMIESSNATGLASTLYGPLIQNYNSGYFSSFNLQNASGVTNNLSVTYYKPDGVSACPSYTYWNVGAYQSITQYPAPHPGCTTATVLSAKFSGGSQPISAMINQTRSGTVIFSGYEAVAQPSKKAYVARVFRNATWTTGLQVQNAGTASTTITITYYNSDGTVHSTQNANVPVNAAASFWPVPPSAPTFDGSAMITTNPAQNIAVVVNWLKTGSGDVLASHIALNR